MDTGMSGMSRMHIGINTLKDHPKGRGQGPRTGGRGMTLHRHSLTMITELMTHPDVGIPQIAAVDAQMKSIKMVTGINMTHLALVRLGDVTGLEVLHSRNKANTVLHHCFGSRSLYMC